jgi:hypothetical protein
MLYDFDVLLEKLNITEQEKKDLLKEVREEFPRMKCYLNYTCLEQLII